jgi:hypothetical protein
VVDTEQDANKAYWKKEMSPHRSSPAAPQDTHGPLTREIANILKKK